MLKQKIFTYLKEHAIDFEHSFHESVTTCQESALARKKDLSIGGKSLLFKSSRFGLCLISFSAAKTLNNARVRKVLKSNKMRFASEQELADSIGVPSGSVPPLGAPFHSIPHYLDLSLLYGQEVAFNPGVLTESIILKTEDYLKMIPHSHYVDLFPAEKT